MVSKLKYKVNTLSSIQQQVSYRISTLICLNSTLMLSEGLEPLANSWLSLPTFFLGLIFLYVVNGDSNTVNCLEVMLCSNPLL